MEVSCEPITLLQRAELISYASSYRAFQIAYYNDPAGFVSRCIVWPEGQGPASYQLEILDALVKKRRVCVRGCHGLGKSALASWAILWFALTRDGRDWKCASLASVFRQVSRFLWPEVHKWARRIRWDWVGRPPFTETELMMLNLRLRTGEAFGMASDNGALIEGLHADMGLYCYDESRSIPDSMWDSTEGAFATGDMYWLAISTPGGQAGRFYDIHVRKPGYEDWFVRHVTLDEAIAAGRIEQEWVDARRNQWGETSPVYLNRVLGEFATEGTGGLIPLSWIDESQERGRAMMGQERKQLVSMGVDVGGGNVGNDASVIALLYADGFVELRKQPLAAEPHMATMELCGRVKGLWEALRPRYLVIDAIGVGAGVLHRLREEGLPALAFNAGGRCDLRDRSGELGFANWRGAGWWTMREALEPGSGISLALPENDELVGELTSPSYRVNSTGHIQIEEKEAIRGRLRRSTDSADALIHALVGPLLEQEGNGGTRWAIVEDGLDRKARY